MVTLVLSLVRIRYRLFAYCSMLSYFLGCILTKNHTRSIIHWLLGCCRSYAIAYSHTPHVCILPWFHSHRESHAEYRCDGTGRAAAAGNFLVTLVLSLVRIRYCLFAYRSILAYFLGCIFTANHMKSIVATAQVGLQRLGISWLLWCCHLFAYAIAYSHTAAYLHTSLVAFSPRIT
ncbi:hypothetical protein HNR77_004767 [Paenibacillus sp. JGP012]|nr:hypothetical protein [Paenibacillus sp. JGP012]